MDTSEQGAAHCHSVVGRTGCGSLNIMFDLYLDAASNNAVAFSPKKLDVIVRDAIQQSGMTLRNAFIDPWESLEKGPASHFYSLAESHVRIETWPEEGHMQGEVQLCHFSRDNTGAAEDLADRIMDALNPLERQIYYLIRGPGPNISVRDVVVGRS